MTYEEFCGARPLFQSFHTGRWGFGRWVHGANLNSAVYRSQQVALEARRASWEKEQAVEAAIDRGEDPRFDAAVQRKMMRLEFLAGARKHA